MELLTAIQNYQPFNEQEALDKELILHHGGLPKSG